MAISHEEVPFSNPSFESLNFEVQQNYEDAHSSLRFSYHANTNAMLRAKMMSMRHADFNSLLSRTAEADGGLLYHILAYNPKVRHATLKCGREEEQEQHISNFQHVGSMIRSLVFEYSRTARNLQARYDAVNAIQTYLTRNIENTILPYVSEDSSHELKAAALSTLTKFIFCTLPIDRSLNRINGLLHARVCDLVGDAMSKVAETLSEEDARLFVEEKELVHRMRELQRLVRQLRWPIDGLEQIMALFRRYGAEDLKPGKLRGTLRQSLQPFRSRSRKSVGLVR